jgi:hypothetical protein
VPSRWMAGCTGCRWTSLRVMSPCWAKCGTSPHLSWPKMYIRSRSPHGNLALGCVRNCKCPMGACDRSAVAPPSMVTARFGRSPRGCSAWFLRREARLQALPGRSRFGSGVSGGTGYERLTSPALPAGCRCLQHAGAPFPWQIRGSWLLSMHPAAGDPAACNQRPACRVLPGGQGLRSGSGGKRVLFLLDRNCQRVLQS